MKTNAPPLRAGRCGPDVGPDSYEASSPHNSAASQNDRGPAWQCRPAVAGGPCALALLAGEEGEDGGQGAGVLVLGGEVERQVDGGPGDVEVLVVVTH